MKFLVAFDFDHTIINENSDIEIRKLVSSSRIPEKVKQLYKTEGWTNYMQAIFKILHENNITKEKILAECRNLKATEGMIQLINGLKNDFNCDVIIISDANSIIIKEWLESVNLTDHIYKIYTNPAYFNEKGILNLQQYHVQDWCELSSVNLCKGSILENCITDAVEPYDIIAYVGDGKNDLCPALKLKESDYLFPRFGYILMKLINEGKHEINSKICPWDSGLDILKVFERIKEDVGIEIEK